MAADLPGRNGHVYIVSAARTPIGRFGGALSTVPAVDLGGVAIRAAVDRAGLPGGTPIDEVLMGHVLQAGVGQAPARQARLTPGITDGAAATIVASERAVERLGLKPLARIVGYAQAEVAQVDLPRPDRGRPPPARPDRAADRGVRPRRDQRGVRSQTLADGRELGFDWDKTNVNGGAIALGHPIGASGARIVATLLHELNRRDGRYGLATLCLGGGGSVAAAFERVA